MKIHEVVSGFILLKGQRTPFLVFKGQLYGEDFFAASGNFVHSADGVDMTSGNIGRHIYSCSVEQSHTYIAEKAMYHKYEDIGECEKIMDIPPEYEGEVTAEDVWKKMQARRVAACSEKKVQDGVMARINMRSGKIASVRFFPEHTDGSGKYVAVFEKDIRKGWRNAPDLDWRDLFKKVKQEFEVFKSEMAVFHCEEYWI